MKAGKTFEDVMSYLSQILENHLSTPLSDKQIGNLGHNFGSEFGWDDETNGIYDATILILMLWENYAIFNNKEFIEWLQKKEYKMPDVGSHRKRIYLMTNFCNWIVMLRKAQTK